MENLEIFGPVPSRRLGRSLGINNIPPKICTYACIYCQLGRAIKMEVERHAFYPVEEIVQKTREKIKRAEGAGEAIDYLTFVPDGEPTLDINLGKEIELLKTLGIKTAVITNASLLWKEDVRTDLTSADWVSLKIDSTEESIWRKINRPHKVLRLNEILEGILAFAEKYSGKLVTETMIVKAVNDLEENAGKVAEFLARLKPSTVYISVPTRPPAEKWVEPPDEDILNRVYQIFDEELQNVEYLIGYEGNTFAFTGNVEEDILSITAVHPMREDAVSEFLSKAKAGWSVIEELIHKGILIETEYGNKKFYARKLTIPYH
ncbi:MAG: radical SAM protein [Candidatus Heimdallarchaeota archaeon]